MGRARNAMEDAFSRAAAGGGAITLRSAANKRPAAGQPGDGEAQLPPLLWLGCTSYTCQC